MGDSENTFPTPSMQPGYKTGEGEGYKNPEVAVLTAIGECKTFTGRKQEDVIESIKFELQKVIYRHDGQEKEIVKYIDYLIKKGNILSKRNVTDIDSLIKGIKEHNINIFYGLR